MTITDTVAEKVCEVLTALAAGRCEPWMMSHARVALPAFQVPKHTKKAPIPSLVLVKARRKAAEEQEDAAKLAMHDEVWEWNLAHGSRCDCGCGYLFRHIEEGECDHWIERSQGGEHTRANGWRLRSECHHAKTANEPSRQDWNLRRADYCIAAGILYIERRAR